MAEGVQETKEQVRDLPVWIDEITNGDSEDQKRRRVYLRRTNLNEAEDSIKRGVNTSVNFTSSMESSSPDPQVAFARFKTVHGSPGEVVIVHIPERIYDEIAETGETIVDKMFDYYDEKRGGIVIPAGWVRGYANQETLEMHLNENYDRDLKDPVSHE